MFGSVVGLSRIKESGEAFDIDIVYWCVQAWCPRCSDARQQQHSPGRAGSKGVPLGRHLFSVHGILDRGACTLVGMAACAGPYGAWFFCVCAEQGAELESVHACACNACVRLLRRLDFCVCAGQDQNESTSMLLSLVLNRHLDVPYATMLRCNIRHDNYCETCGSTGFGLVLGREWPQGRNSYTQCRTQPIHIRHVAHASILVPSMPYIQLPHLSH